MASVEEMFRRGRAKETFSQRQNRYYRLNVKKKRQHEQDTSLYDPSKPLSKYKKREKKNHLPILDHPILLEALIPSSLHRNVSDRVHRARRKKHNLSSSKKIPCNIS